MGGAFPGQVILDCTTKLAKHGSWGMSQEATSSMIPAFPVPFPQ